MGERSVFMTTEDYARIRSKFLSKAAKGIDNCIDAQGFHSALLELNKLWQRDIAALLDADDADQIPAILEWIRGGLGNGLMLIPHSKEEIQQMARLCRSENSSIYDCDTLEDVNRELAAVKTKISAAGNNEGSAATARELVRFLGTAVCILHTRERLARIALECAHTAHRLLLELGEKLAEALIALGTTESECIFYAGITVSNVGIALDSSTLICRALMEAVLPPCHPRFCFKDLTDAQRLFTFGVLANRLQASQNIELVLGYLKAGHCILERIEKVGKMASWSAGIVYVNECMAMARGSEPFSGRVVKERVEFSRTALENLKIWAPDSLIKEAEGYLTFVAFGDKLSAAAMYTPGPQLDALAKICTAAEERKLQNKPVCVCAQCGVRNPEPFRCGRCKKTVYCSRACQTADWKKHKLACVPANKET